MNETVLLEIKDEIATITLNRPERLNAVNFDLMVGFHEAVKTVAETDNIGCVIVTGAGRGFCAGGDRKEGARPRPNPDGTMPSFGLGEATEACRLLREMPTPTIAMVNGPVAGAGIGIAGSCDLRFAAKSATFLSAYDNIGGAGDYGATYTWVRALGAAKAREVFLLGERFTADEALAFGIYTRVFPDDELRGKTYAAARRLADGPRPGWALMKENLNTAEQQCFAEHLLNESRNMGLSTSASFKWMRDRHKASKEVQSS